MNSKLILVVKAVRPQRGFRAISSLLAYHYQSFQFFDYGKVCAILIILILATTIIDTISAKLRNWLV